MLNEQICLNLSYYFLLYFILADKDSCKDNTGEKNEKKKINKNDHC